MALQADVEIEDVTDAEQPASRPSSALSQPHQVKLIVNALVGLDLVYAFSILPGFWKAF